MQFFKIKIHREKSENHNIGYKYIRLHGTLNNYMTLSSGQRANNSETKCSLHFEFSWPHSCNFYFPIIILNLLETGFGFFLKYCYFKHFSKTLDGDFTLSLFKLQIPLIHFFTKV